MKILAIDGSPRKGVVSEMLNEALDAAKKEALLGSHEEAETSIIRLANIKIRPHDGKLKGIPRPLKNVFDEMLTADGYIFGTPVHWYNMSSLMKCFIDWLTSLEQKRALEGKVVGVIAHCNDDGGNQAVMSIFAPLFHMGVIPAPYSAFYRNKFVGVNSEDGWQMKDQVLVGQNIARLIPALRHNNRGWRQTAD